MRPWMPFAPGWYRQGLICVVCRAETHDPATFGWRQHRDASGFRVARCPRCQPIAAGASPGGAGAGLAASRRRGATAANAARRRVRR
jgi:hypothetical protein